MKKPANPRPEARSRNSLVDEKLDAALIGTFPASDPFSVGPAEEPCAPPAYASPPCFQHELDPSYHGYMEPGELVTLLNRLLEGERAGAKGVAEMARDASEPEHRSILRGIAGDEANFCAMLSRHITRLESTPSRATGAFYRKLRAQGTARERLILLDRGQRWVVKALQAALPKIQDNAIHRDLKEMLLVHERNIEKASTLIG